jgi:signal transduction histidine kinase
VTVEVRGAPDQVTIAVHNRGAVIPPEQLDGIFNPLRARRPPELRATQTAAGGPTGSLGLGLYIAERIVRAHDGHLDVTSSEADGTTFTIHLPRQEQPPTA